MNNSIVSHTANLRTAAIPRLLASIGGVIIRTVGAMILVGVCGVPQATATGTAIVFDNTPNTNGGLGFTQLPYGAEVTLSGANRRITEIDLGVG